jgi:hypothetical protein
MLKNVLAVATTLALLVVSLPASATPFVDVRAHWDAFEYRGYPLAEGISISCRGDANVSDRGCSFTTGLHRSVTESGTYEVTSTGSVVLTNTSDRVINDFGAFEAWHSSFNPGGPHIGIGIDDPLTQWGTFESRVSGLATGDSHSCAVGYLGESGTVFSPTTCGVGSPDSSLGHGEIDLTGFLPGEEILLTYMITISATFVLNEAARVPEPGAALLLVGLAGLALSRRRSRS